MEKYWVIQNVGAGVMEIFECDSDTLAELDDNKITLSSVIGAYFNVVFESNSKEDCKNFIEEEKKRTTSFCVFYDYLENDGYVAEMNCCSGTCQAHSPYELVKSFKTKDEAESYLREVVM